MRKFLLNGFERRTKQKWGNNDCVWAFKNYFFFHSHCRENTVLVLPNKGEIWWSAVEIDPVEGWWD